MRFLVLRHDHFLTENWQFSMNFDRKSKYKNRKNLKINFSFFHFNESNSKEGGGEAVCISLFGTRPEFGMLNLLAHEFYNKKFIVKKVELCLD